jgi:hypothetical protein
MPQIEEVEEAKWFDLEEAWELLSYPGERNVALKAAEVLAARS